MSQFNTPQRWNQQGPDPLTWFLDPQGIDFSNPNAFMSNLGPNQAPPSSGGRPKKPKPPKDGVPTSSSPPDSSPTSAPASSSSASSTGLPPLTNRQEFERGLMPFVENRLRMARTPLEVKRAWEWYYNRLEGYDARQKTKERNERQRVTLIDQYKREREQREANRQYRANLAKEIAASEQFGEQNAGKIGWNGQPVTGLSPEQQMAANRAAVKADNDYITKMNQDYLAALSAQEAASRAYGEANPAKPQGMTSAEQLAQTRADYDAEAAKAKQIRDDATLERVKKRFADQAASYSVVPNTTPLPLPVNPATDKYNRDQAEMARIQEEMLGRVLGPVRGVLDKALDDKQQQDVRNLLQSTPTGRLSSLAEPPTITGPQVRDPLTAGPTVEQAGGFAPSFNPNLVQSEIDLRQSGIDAVRAAGYNPAPYELRKQVGERWGDPGYADRGDENSKANIGIDRIEQLRSTMPRQPGLDTPLGGPGGYTGKMDATRTKTLNQEIDRANYMNEMVPVDMGGGRVDMMPRWAASTLINDGSMSALDRPANVPNAAEQAMAQGDYKTALLLSLIPGVGFDPMAPQGSGGQVNPLEALGAVPAVGPATRAGRAIGAGAEEAARAASGPAGRFAASEGTGVMADAIRTRGAVAGELANEAARGLNVNRAAAERAASAAAANPANASRTLRSAAIENAERALQTPSQIRGAATAERMATRDADQAISRLAEPDVPNVDLRTTKADRFARLSPEEKATELMKAYDRSWNAVSAGRMTNEEFNTMVANTLKGKNGELFRKALDDKYPGTADEILRARP